MNIPNRRSRNGFTLVELTICCVIFFIVFWFVASPYLYPHYSAAHRVTCISNEKQIALAFLQYVQDYDECFPPVASFIAIPSGTSRPAVPVRINWAIDRTLSNGILVQGLLSSYTKSNALFLDPSIKVNPSSASHLFYMYNDLVATQKMADLANVSQTVLITDAEDQLENTGHAFTPDHTPFSATPNRQGTCDAGQGASIRNARTRHSGGAHFAFTDGHVKWVKGGTDDPIFFPPHDSANLSAIDKNNGLPLGPQPDGDMHYQGHIYIGTFHLR